MVSFHGVRQQVSKELQRVEVKDVMTKKVQTFHPDQSLGDVVKTLLEKKISGGPVCDDQKNLVGIISEGDCLKQVVRGKYLNMPQATPKVSDAMVRDVKTMPPNLSVLEAANMFLELKLRRFPVMENGKLLGQVSQRDIMQAVIALKEETW